MSEAVNSREIEDVLSSIRRLVSDDLQPAAGTGPAAGRAQDGADKLLLTPALRVVSSDASGHGAGAPALDAVLASVSAAVDQQSEDWESETGDLAPVAVEMPAAASADLAADGAGDLAPMAVDVVEGDWEDHRIDAYAEPVPLRRPVPEAAEVAAPEAETPAAAAADPDLPGWAQSEGAEDAETPPTAAWAAGTIEPDQAWADAAEAAVLQELASAGEPSQIDTAEDSLIETEAAELPFDEAVLREIVRDVLREELQGPLGERITRNIRKLVRAEIARSLAAEDLM